MQKKNKSQFKTLDQIKEVPSQNINYLITIQRILSGEISEGIIAQLPLEKGGLYIDNFKLQDIALKHGQIPLENMVITANEPTLLIEGTIEDVAYFTLVYELEDSFFILSSRKFNGHYVVTFFESLDIKYLKSIKKRGEVVFDKKKTS